MIQNKNQKKIMRTLFLFYRPMIKNKKKIKEFLNALIKRKSESGEKTEKRKQLETRVIYLKYLVFVFNKSIFSFINSLEFFLQEYKLYL